MDNNLNGNSDSALNHLVMEEMLVSIRQSLQRSLKDLDVEDIKDAIGDALEKAVRHEKLSLLSEELQRWLYRVAYNHCLDILRQRRRRMTCPSGESDNHITRPPNQNEVDVSVDFGSFRQSLSRMKTAILILLSEGNSVMEAADMRGLESKTVYKYRDAIKSAFKQMLKIPRLEGDEGMSDERFFFSFGGKFRLSQTLYICGPPLRSEETE